jgi:hypothetical protein
VLFGDGIVTLSVGGVSEILVALSWTSVRTTEAMEHDVHPPLDRLQHECLHIRGDGDSPRRQFLHFDHTDSQIGR